MRFLLKLFFSPRSLFGMFVGAGLAWFSDPEKGPERRAQAMASLRDRKGTNPPTQVEGPATTTEPTLWTPGESPAAAAV